MDFYSGKCLAKVAGHSELATGVRFTPDGRRLVTTGGEGVWGANSYHGHSPAPVDDHGGLQAFMDSFGDACTDL